VDWSDLFLLLVVGQTGSIRKAAEVVGQTQSTIGRRLELLEERLGARLLVRDANGARLTEEGEIAADRALTMSRSVCDLEDIFATLDREVAGEVCISCGEALAAPFLAPRLWELGGAHPKLRVRLLTELPIKEPGSGEADVSVQYFAAKNMESVAVRLGTVHYCLFGTQKYFDVYGPVDDVAEQALSRHRVITHSAYRAQDPSWSERTEHLHGLSNFVTTTDSSACMVEAAASGAGLAVMPSYAALYDARLVVVDAPPLAKVPFWLVYRGSMRHAARVEVVNGWIKGVFERAQNPWFREEFVHPREFGGAALPRELAS
jgi:DNA-binding transcriptional LysR family regulator